MAVIRRTSQQRLEDELRARFEKLLETIQPRDLNHPSEGAGRNSSWSSPEDMCALKGSDMNRRLAVEDFKAILAEVKSIK
ncbi:hypothetical protein [Chromobacterium violaceum]|uniref:hypothetical protein n=1 Tax=Chromobacterium violaceum TaxID=536 RepID=UPI001125121F|nr:hypothetical protein [Chromobacterium violaceum]